MSGSNAGAWDAYWQKAIKVGFHNKEAEHREIEQFWRQFFTCQFEQQSRTVILELACGKGAVSEIAHQCLEKSSICQPPNQNAEIEVRHYCLDYSLAAVKNTLEKPGLEGGIVADAAALPLKNNSADLVFSQFGIEYAGRKALLNAAKIVKPGGRLAAIIHHANGLIYQHSKCSVKALERVMQTDIFPLARRAFTAGFEVLNGNTGQETFVRADSDMSVAVKQITALLKQQGPSVADGIILQFYRDLGDMFNRLQVFEAKDIANWLNNMEDDFSSHLQRMQSMLDAACDKEAMAFECQQLTAEGLSIEHCEEIASHQGILGWKLIAKA
ncbi:class I SAM-dependent methyltransferase [Lacimicrobium alkaliphilum]|uniref:Methyltransferase type 11 domain-containing protein n=1 Tax=Lacimicrobium alkaliphilum TaxID=1526571 RepID=A0ABQ1QYC8_9ALTE|nr:class I SAM-dependent methyltransferase [Lacimicrobium alkaliphilum]GGD48201.1 hypothetical protein GCM10011357_00150 [Lacimicrobium alkaliphilum]